MNLRRSPADPANTSDRRSARVTVRQFAGTRVGGRIPPREDLAQSVEALLDVQGAKGQGGDEEELIAANWFILLCAVMAFIGIRAAVIPREERQLQARFGASYDQYISRTGALWPRHLRRSGG